MNNILCILERASNKFKNQIAVSENGNEITFHELHLMANYLYSEIKKINNLYIIVKATPTSFYIALIFACIRNKKIFVPVSPKEKDCNILELSAELDAYVIDETLFKNIKTKDFEITKNFYIDPYIPCNIIMSSGSTGKPKKIVHCLNNHIKSALGAQQKLKIQSNDSYLLSLPLNHVGGQSIIFKSILFGARIVITNKTLFEAISDNKVTILSLVPTQLYRLLEKNNQYFSLRAILIGGAPTSKELLLNSQKKHPYITFYTSYGLTEMSSQVCTCILDNNDYHLGFPLKYRQLKILNGEILVKGETLCLGYLNNGKIISATDDNGWFHTKDLGELNTLGLKVIGRKDNQFISGGENIQPESIEQIIIQLPGVLNVAIVPIPDIEWGNIICCVIKINNTVNQQDIINMLSTKINHIYLPKIWITWPEAIDTLKIKRKTMQNFAINFLKTKKTAH